MWMFVYGTLRPGHVNYGMLEGAVKNSMRSGTATGRLYHVYGGDDEWPIYPVARFDEEGTIVGDLLEVDPSNRHVQAVQRMELGAGYLVQSIEVTTADGPVQALAWHYPHETGDRIVSGDWNSLFTAVITEGDR